MVYVAVASDVYVVSCNEIYVFLLPCYLQTLWLCRYGSGGKKQKFTIIYILSTCKAFVFVASEFYRSYSLYCSLCSEIFFLEVVQCDNLSDVVLSVKYSQVLKLKSASHLPWNILIEIITVCWILIPCISSILPFWRRVWT